MKGLSICFFSLNQNIEQCSQVIQLLKYVEKRLEKERGEKERKKKTERKEKRKKRKKEKETKTKTGKGEGKRILVPFFSFYFFSFFPFSIFPGFFLSYCYFPIPFHENRCLLSFS